MGIHTRIRRARFASGRGQGLVELALLMPVLVLMIAGVVDVGRGLAAYMQVINAVREGARYGELYPTDTAGIQARVQNEAAGEGISITNIQVTYPSGNASGDPIQVSADYEFMTILLSIFGRPTIDMTGVAQMVIL